MTSLPVLNVGDYVVARHENGRDEIRGTVDVSQSDRYLLLIVGGEPIWLKPNVWSFELAERPQPPLEDGIYQKGDFLRFRRSGVWFYPPNGLAASACTASTYEDDYYRDFFGYVGPEVSR